MNTRNVWSFIASPVLTIVLVIGAAILAILRSKAQSDFVSGFGLELCFAAVVITLAHEVAKTRISEADYKRSAEEVMSARINVAVASYLVLTVLIAFITAL